MKRILVLISALGLSASGCGDNHRECGAGTVEDNGRCIADGDNVTCGEGTFEFMGECRPFDPSDTTTPTTTASPGGGTFVALPEFVVLSSDEPAEIHYTTDGSMPTTSSPSEISPVFIVDIDDGTELRYFAVDEAGNEESVKSELYQLDLAPPAPVMDLTASDDGSQVDLSWTNPTDSDLAGVMIVRSQADVGQFEPVAGASYAVGDAVGPGEEVVFVGTGTAATDTGAITGFNGYHAWTFDTAGNYSRRRFAAAVRQGGAQTATLSVAIDGTVTVNSQPANMTLAGTGTYDDVGDTMTIALTVQNDLARTIHNPKAMITSVSVGALDNADGQLGGTDFVYYGPESLAFMGTRSRDLVISGVPGTTVSIDIELEIRDDPMLITSTWFAANTAAQLIDTGTLSKVGEIGCDSYKFALATQDNCAWRRGVMSRGGRYLYIGSRANTVIRVIDLTTLEVIGALSLGSSFGFVDGVVRGGELLYAVMSTTGHAFDGGNKRSDGSVYLVEIEPRGPELSELRRLAVVGDAAQAENVNGRVPAITPNRTVAAVPISRRGEVVLVELANMTIIDTDTDTPEVDNLDVSGTGMTPKEVAFSPDGTTLFVGFAQNAATQDVLAVQLADFSATALPTTLTNATGVADMTVDADGRLWVSRIGVDDADGGAISVYDLSGPTETVLATHGTPLPNIGNRKKRYADAVAFSPDGSEAYVPMFIDNQNLIAQLAIFTTSDLMRVDTDGNAGNGVTNVPLPTRPGGHVALITPF
jgi:hypothetical protein